MAVVSDERLKELSWNAERGLTHGEFTPNIPEIMSICTELLARRRECQAARAMRDLHYNEYSDTVDAYDRSRAETDAIGEKK